MALISRRFTVVTPMHDYRGVIQKKLCCKCFPHRVLLLCILFSLAVCQLGVYSASAATPKQKYFNAEACYNHLKQSSSKQKYRHNWLRCINGFYSVYKTNPSDPWAPAGLYMSGKLYYELYKLSRKASDKKEAVEIFERLVKRYPGSKYRQKSAVMLKKLTGSSAGNVRKKSASHKTISPKTRYLTGNRCYLKLKRDSSKQKYRDNWLKCIHQFNGAYQTNPSDPWAPAGLYMSGKLYYELYEISRSPSDKQEAVDRFQRVIERYPRSKYRQHSKEELRAVFGEDASVQIVEKHRDNETAQDSDSGNKETDSPSTGSATVTGIRFWSNPNYTRVVIDLNDETSYTHNLLKKDPSNHMPQRLYVDFENSILGKDINRVIAIDDDLLRDARAGQFTRDKVRVVVDIKSFQKYEVFSLNNPFRLVMDIWGEGAVIEKSSLPVATPKTSGKKIPAGDLAKQFALGVQKIVIDAGHGGRDYGAPGYIKGVHEKDITLAIAKKLAQKIKKELPCEVILTRETDKYLTLEERTAIANTKNADLFISIHTNASRSRHAFGIETYSLNLASDDDAVQVAARENATSRKNISDLEAILSNLMNNSKINESSRLAGYIQKSICGHLESKGYGSVRNKGVKQAPFYVLIGAQMPAILVETSFISNSRECRRLTLPQYQERISEGIVKGIFQYIKELNPTALKKNPEDVMRKEG